MLVIYAAIDRDKHGIYDMKNATLKLDRAIIDIWTGCPPPTQTRRFHGLRLPLRLVTEVLLVYVSAFSVFQSMPSSSIPSCHVLIASMIPCHGVTVEELPLRHNQLQVEPGR